MGVQWYTKCLWLIESRNVKDVPDDLHSILHSNRAIANVKLQRWADAEADSCAALALNCNNTKARYRRAIARYEMDRPESALEDIEQVIKRLPDPNSNIEVLELKSKITERLKNEKPLPGTDECRGPRILLKVKDPQGSEVHFSIRKSRPLQKLMEHYCSMTGLQSSHVRFMVDGECIAANASAEQLGLHDGNIIDVQTENG